MTPTFTVSSPALPSLLSCNLSCSEPFRLPIYLTSLHVTTPSPESHMELKITSFGLPSFISVYRRPTQFSLYPFPALLPHPTILPTNLQTASLAINQPLVLRAVIKGYFISSTKGNQYQHHYTGAYVSTFSASSMHSR